MFRFFNPNPAGKFVEGMYDEAKTDYERNQLHKFIEMIRAAG